jgi:hypothetical protein
MPTRRAALYAACILFAIAPLGAQSAPGGELTEHSIWFVYAGDHPISKRAGFVFDAQLRLTEDGDHLRQLLVRPGVSFAASAHLKFSAGYALMGARDDGNDPFLPRRPEHRLWAGALFGHDVGPVAVSHRARLEHRWLSGVRVDDAGNAAGEVWVHAERARYQLRAAVPLTRGARRHDVYVAGSDEMFASFGGYAGAMAFDQNRASLALGVRAAPAVRLELGYMLQSSAGDDGRFTEQNHTLQLTVVSSARLR